METDDSLSNDEMRLSTDATLSEGTLEGEL
jgi:hypothetical protein